MTLPITARIRPRRDTAVNWTAENPVLGDGELALDTTNRMYKVGDGATEWNDLDWLSMVYFSKQTVTVDGATTAVTLERIGNIVQLNMGENTTLTITGTGQDCEYCQLKVVQDATGGRTLDITGEHWDSGVKLSLTVDADAVDWLHCWTDDGWTAVNVVGAAFAMGVPI
jgi:hypothetical protein